MVSFKVKNRYGDWSYLGQSKNLPLPEGAILELDTVRTGEERPIQLEGAMSYKQDALRTWADGSSKVIKGFYTRVVPDAGHENDDWCGWCGANNGPNGIDRNGYDCCYCGGS